VFSEDVGDAHMRGDIHLHDLGFIDRPYCSGQSLEYIKKFGLNLPNSLSMASRPASGSSACAHGKVCRTLQSNFAGAIGWDAVNLFFCALSVRPERPGGEAACPDAYLEFSQQAVARGGQAIFTDINLYWEVPKHFEDVPAIGPGGGFTGKTYAAYEKDAQRFVWALFDVYKEGDGTAGRSFSPSRWCISPRVFRTEGHEEFCCTSVTLQAKRATPILCLTGAARQRFPSAAA